MLNVNTFEIKQDPGRINTGSTTNFPDTVIPPITCARACLLGRSRENLKAQQGIPLNVSRIIRTLPSASRAYTVR
jgi:hypothetical protein